MPSHVIFHQVLKFKLPQPPGAAASFCHVAIYPLSTEERSKRGSTVTHPLSCPVVSILGQADTLHIDAAKFAFATTHRKFSSQTLQSASRYELLHY